MKEKILQYMNIAIKEAKKSLKHDDVPVGAIIVCNDKIIAKAHNTKQHKKNAINHAEIIAINKACKKKKSWYLNNCSIYISLEPCMMCYGAIIQSRIANVYYATSSTKYGDTNNINDLLSLNSNHKPNIVKITDEESSEILKKFFKDKRD